MAPRTFYLIALTTVVTDQLTKWVVGRSVPAEGRPVFGSFFSLTPTQNTGGAFSLLQTYNWVFVVIAIVAVVALLYVYHLHQRRDLATSCALALALGGAVGNLVDRAQFGHVRDFFHLHTAAHETLWPIFNVADSAITVSIVILAARIVFPARRQAPNDEPVGGSV